MTEELSSRLLNLTFSPKNDNRLDNIFKIVVDHELSFLQESGRIKEALKGWMNPKDMTLMKLVAGSIISINNRMIICWPSALTKSKGI